MTSGTARVRCLLLGKCFEDTQQRPQSPPCAVTDTSPHALWLPGVPGCSHLAIAVVHPEGHVGRHQQQERFLLRQLLFQPLDHLAAFIGPLKGVGDREREDMCYSPNLPTFTLTATLKSTVSTLQLGKWPQSRRNAVNRIHRTPSCSERCSLQNLYTWTGLCSPIPAVPAELQSCVATVPAVPCIFRSRGCSSIMSLGSHSTGSKELL